MLSLPSLAPPDCYTLWYTSSSSPNTRTITDQDDQNFGQTQHQDQHQNQHLLQHRHQNTAFRTPLAHLRTAEESIRNRKKNITDFGAAWLKPPGVPKSLQQLREEERELREYQETLRQEQLAQELAEAAMGGEMDSFLQGEEGLDEIPDLDDEVPEADNSGFYSNEDDDIGDEDAEPDNEVSGLVTRDNLTMPGELYHRETLIHERLLYDDSSNIDEKDLPGMLEEEDLIPECTEYGLNNRSLDYDQDVDLDVIPEAESYDHTDTEEETSSSEDEEESFKLDVVRMQL